MGGVRGRPELGRGVAKGGVGVQKNRVQRSQCVQAEGQCGGQAWVNKGGGVGANIVVLG